MRALDLSAADAALFGCVVFEFQEARPAAPASQREFEELRQLVSLYGGDLVLRAIREVPASGQPLSRVSQIAALLELEDPLLRQIMALHAGEIAPHQPITGRLHSLLLNMKEEFPDIELWREAVTRAVRSGHRNLEAVDKLLRRHQATGGWDPPSRARKSDHARAKEPKRRPASRETKYDAEALERGSKSEDPAKWERPSDLI